MFLFSSLFLNFFDNKTKQASFVRSEPLSIEEFEKLGVLEGISVSLTGIGLNNGNFFKALVSNDEVYLYANIKGCTIPQPLDIIPMNLTTYLEVFNEVYANGVLFYKSYNVVNSKDRCIMKFGQSFTVTYKPDYSAICSFRKAGTLKERIIDLDFILNAIRAKSFVISNKEYPFNPPKKELDGFGFDHQVEILKKYRKLQEVFELLSVRTDFIIENITEENERDLSKLITSPNYHC